MRLLWLFLGLAVLFLLPFLFWGDLLTSTFTATGAVEWLADYGRWAWAAGLVLLTSDLLLPVPGTVVMSALGYLYGTVAGGLLSAAGSFLSGALAYVLCRRFGTGAARRILGDTDFERGERLFARVGGWLVVLSRWLPILPEVVACMAGLTRMPARTFFLALACGSLPPAFTFAAVGQAGTHHPLLAVLASAVIPVVFWLLVRPFIWQRAEARS